MLQREAISVVCLWPLEPFHASRNNVICSEEHIDNKWDTQTGFFMNISYTQQGCHPLWFTSEREINLLFDCRKAVGLCLTFHKSLMCVHYYFLGDISYPGQQLEVLGELILTGFDWWKCIGPAGDGHWQGCLCNNWRKLFVSIPSYCHIFAFGNSSPPLNKHTFILNWKC